MDAGFEIGVAVTLGEQDLAASHDRDGSPNGVEVPQLHPHQTIEERFQLGRVSGARHRSGGGRLERGRHLRRRHLSGRCL